MNWLIIAIVLLLANKQYLASPTPLKLPGHTQRLTPYIKHWEAANFERAPLEEAHRKHIEQKRHRRKRELNNAEYGPAHTIRLKFFAHDREFRLVLHQDPLSVFASDVEIENSLGPMHYDISRVYTGSLEDDENSHVHAILTIDNLLDGTIETTSEHYYVEPAHKYSYDLPQAGIHSIIYKISDVDMERRRHDATTDPTTIASSAASTSTTTAQHCASERLRQNFHSSFIGLMNEGGGHQIDIEKNGKGKRTTKEPIFRETLKENGKGIYNNVSVALLKGSAASTVMVPLDDKRDRSRLNHRHKRWLPDELSTPSTSDIKQDPPLPLDLDVPYNGDFGIYAGSEEKTYNPFIHIMATTTSTTPTTTTTPTQPTTNPMNRQDSNNRSNLRTGAVITWRGGGDRNNIIRYSMNGSEAGFIPSRVGIRKQTEITTTTTKAPTGILTMNTTKSTRNRNVIANVYNPNWPSVVATATTTTSTAATTTMAKTTKATNDDRYFSNNYGNNNNNNNLRKIYTKHKNIIVSNYNRSIANNNYNNNNNNYNNNVPYDKNRSSSSSSNNNNNNNNNYSNKSNNKNNIYNRNANNDHSNNENDNNFINTLFNTNWTTIPFNDDQNDRPIHKTHVEIITKNGATKRPPNIIVNNYNPPEITLTPTNNNNNNNNHHHPNFNGMLMTNVLSGRGQGGDDDGDSYDSDGSHSRNGDSVRSLYDRKITCMLYLQADHTFFQKMGSDEASIEAITRHVQRANAIYKNTDFNNDGKPDNITFMIKRIKVHNANALKDPAYRFPGNYGVEKFLELFSEEDYDAFCLAYMFTYRDFEMGTLGLAWTGDLKNAGGVCEKNGHYRGSLKSLNTGIVTLLNYGKHVPPAVSHVTLAHEIGHNFGSPHDPEQCTPGGEDGNFIMFARATSGDKKNNNKFSPCSLKSIEPVLNAKARSVKGCFTEPQTSICGNGVVEPGEQCDCGWEEDCKDLCCFPMSRHPRSDEKPCTLTPQARCSPSQGPCCTTDCKVKFGDKCRDDNGCRDPSYCDGRMPQCPPSINKPNKTICNKEFVCYMGDCTGSICLAYGLESCQCIPGPNDDKIKSCELCCKLPGEDNPCRSSFEWNEPPFDVPDMFAKPGTPCNDYNGYCDVFQKCREVDPNGPLATLRKLLLSEESIANFKKWIQQNWYTVALASVGIFILLILSLKLLTRRSKLKLKSVTIIHSATTETVRLPDDNNGVIVHTAVRTKVPFKKKVRGQRSAKNALPTAIANNKSANNNTNSNNNNNANNNANKQKSSTVANKVINKSMPLHTKMFSSEAAEESHQQKKQIRSKKNRISAPPQATNLKASNVNVTNTVNQSNQMEFKSNTAAAIHDAKSSNVKSKGKFKKQHNNKEIIDYSTRNVTMATSASTMSSGLHTNTFGKVQKWLLESPIVAQPLSHIEHSSKVRKVMKKSQSTPERLVQKSPQKTKSMGSLANNGDKVRLQVVYKPPFKFSLRLSKNAKVKTHVIGAGAIGKMRRKSRTGPANASKRFSNTENNGGSGGGSGAGGSKSSGGVGERTKRTALLLRTGNKNDEDNQVLTLNEPNYETLNPKTLSKPENPFYENLQYKQVGETRTGSNSDAANATQTISAGSGPNMSRSSSKTNLDASQIQRSSQNYHRSHSLTPANAFNVISQGGRLARNFSDSTNSTNLSRNFGSTQNLINNSNHSNLSRSMKRSSLNLKSSISKNGKDPPPKKRSNSNMNLRRDSLTPILPTDAMALQQQLQLPQQPPSMRITNGETSTSSQQQQQQNQQQQQQQQQHLQKLPPYAAQRSARASFSNIPRASLNLNLSNATTTAASPASVATAISGGVANTSANIINTKSHSNNNNKTRNANSNNNDSNLAKFNFINRRPSAPAPTTNSTNNKVGNINTNKSNVFVDIVSLAAPNPPTTATAVSSHEQLRRSRSNMTVPTFALPQQHHQQQQQQQQRSSSIRQHQHNHHPPPLPPSDDHDHESPSNTKPTISDADQLVS